MRKTAIWVATGFTAADIFLNIGRIIRKLLANNIILSMPAEEYTYEFMGISYFDGEPTDEYDPTRWED